MSTSNCLLACHNLSVMRGNFVLCQRVSLTVNSGEICHLIGENGIGKTTLLMMIAGLLPDENIQKSGDILYLSHQSGLHELLSVSQNLRFLLGLYGIDELLCRKVFGCSMSNAIADALAQVDLIGYEDVAVAKLSAGQMRRVNLARLWLTTPDITPLWLLDEPLTALDIAMVDKLTHKISQFAQAGGGVLITSHQMIDCAVKTVNLADFLPIDGDFDEGFK